MHRFLREAICRSLLTLIAAFLGMAVASNDAPAAAPPPADSSRVATGAGPSSTAATPAKPPSAAAVRGAAIFSAFVLWCVIVIVGIGLLATVMIWGRRLRRSLYQRPMPATSLDPFWYLKKTTLPALNAGSPKTSRADESGNGQAGLEKPGGPPES
jgi:hypothetical protein